MTPSVAVPGDTNPSDATGIACAHSKASYIISVAYITDQMISNHALRDSIVTDRFIKEC